MQLFYKIFNMAFCWLAGGGMIFFLILEKSDIS